MKHEEMNPHGPPGLAAMILGLSGAAALLTLFRGLTGFLLFGQLRRQKQEGPAGCWSPACWIPPWG